jgi:cell division protein ZapA (FtsZ GTPase activity inhibitor)
MKCGEPEFSYRGSGGLFRWNLFSDWLLALLIMVPLMLGKMPAWSQASDPKLNNSNETSPDFELSLETLNSLHNQASSQLTELTQRLNQAFQEVQTSKQQLTSLRSLLDNALEKSADLENANQRISEFNQQIRERMQERDTDLANAHDALDAQARKILKMWIIIATLGSVCLGFITFGVIKLLIKLHVL